MRLCSRGLTNVITAFCHYVLLFGSPGAGRQWVDRHSGTFLLNPADAFEFGRRFNALRLGRAQGVNGPGA